MKVRTELTSLMAGSFLAIAAALGIYFLIVSSVNGIERERAVLADLANGTKDYQLALMSVLADTIGLSQRNFAAATAAYRKKFERVDSIKLLLSTDADTKKAIESIKALRALIDPDIEALAAAIVAAIVAASFLLSLRRAAAISGAIVAIGRALSAMAAGDLTVEVPRGLPTAPAARSENEITALARARWPA